MEEHPACEAAKSFNERRPSAVALAWKEARWRLYLLWLRFGYRHVARFMHRYNVHLMKPLGRPWPDDGRLNPNIEYSKCEWCGLMGQKIIVRSVL